VVDNHEPYEVHQSSLYKVSYTSEFYENPLPNKPSLHQLLSFEFARLKLSSRLNRSLGCIHYQAPCCDWTLCQNLDNLSLALYDRFPSFLVKSAICLFWRLIWASFSLLSLENVSIFPFMFANCSSKLIASVTMISMTIVLEYLASTCEKSESLGDVCKESLLP